MEHTTTHLTEKGIDVRYDDVLKLRIVGYSIQVHDEEMIENFVLLYTKCRCRMPSYSIDKYPNYTEYHFSEAGMRRIASTLKGFVNSMCNSDTALKQYLNS